MVDKLEKYYAKNSKNQWGLPKMNYTRNDGITTTLRTIRLTPEELANWDTKLVHEFLQGSTDILTHDSEVIGKQTRILNSLRDMFENGVLKVYRDKLTPEYKKILEEL